MTSPNEPGHPERGSIRHRAGRVRARYAGRVSSLLQAIRENDEARIEEAVLRLSQSRRIFAPLAFGVGAFALMFDSLKMLVSNWRLLLVQILPAMWIWLAMFDLKVHVLHGRSFNVLRGPILIPIALVITGLTVASFFLNAVFAFAISRPGAAEIRPAFDEAQRHKRTIILSGVVVGLCLTFATVIVTRWGHPWFALSLGAVIGVMMICYVAIPSRLIGGKPAQSRRDRLWLTGTSTLLGATICTPPYALGRLGLLMLGSKLLFIPGVIFLAVGVTLQAGATGSVRAIKMSVKLKARDGPPADRHHARDSPAQDASGADHERAPEPSA